MPLPDEDSKVTQDQIKQALNSDKFPDSKPGKNWHDGQFEPWALDFGYPDGKPRYGSVEPGGYHIYWLNDGHQAPIILKPGETPDNYGIKPQKSG